MRIEPLSEGIKTGIDKIGALSVSPVEHSAESLAGWIASEAGCRKLLLVHLYPECEGRDILGPCSRNFKGDVMVAEDLMRLTVCNRSPLSVHR